MKVEQAYIKYFKADGFNDLCTEGAPIVKSLPYLSIVQATEGSYGIKLGNEEEQNTGKGGFFIAPANVLQTITHHIDSVSKKMSARWVFVDCEVNGRYKFDKLFLFPTVVKGETVQKLSEIFNKIFAAESILEKMSLSYLLLQRLAELASPAENYSDERIERAAEYAERNFADKITVKELAKAACMSQANFYGVFKKTIGVSPMKYLNNYRLSVACDWLLFTDMPIAEIAEKAGFYDQFYFSRMFRSVFGVCPREY
ncbi:MAG: AraC family transcriptional regulator, partial [Candidatus Borkfalkiaceae bacterium]|nr:AraC family transcriptional regulator [Clostridia bacterium]MDY6222554.1 AraC family transcriptional regulator [Christensenellaceae bacterium]